MEVTYLLHATEDPDRVRAAVSEAFAVESAPEEEPLEGHYGNKIVRVVFHVTGDEADRAFHRMIEGLGPALRRELLEGLGGHVDEHQALFVRFDKQALVSGSLSFGAGDSVRVKVKPRGRGLRGGARTFYADALARGA